MFCLQSSPCTVTSEQRQLAENDILNFRKSKMPYNLCRYILGNLLFYFDCYCVATIQVRNILCSSSSGNIISSNGYL